MFIIEPKLRQAPWGARESMDRGETPEALAFYVQMNRMVQNARFTGITGRAPSSEDVAAAERNRAASLRILEDEILARRLRAEYSAADYLYVLNLLYNSVMTYAHAAEEETRTFITRIAGNEFVDLTAGKGSSETGPDGIFLGGVRALGLPRNTALEVKTATSTQSLERNITKMLSRAKNTRTADGWRGASHAATVEALRDAKRGADADRLAAAGVGALTTLLVVRETAVIPDNVQETDAGLMRIPDDAYAVFDLVLHFDLFGYPVYETYRTRRERSGMIVLDDRQWDEIESAAGDFNLSRARRVIDEMIAGIAGSGW